MKVRKLMPKVFFIITVLILSYNFAEAKRKVIIFEEADNFYNLKRYPDAALKYQKVIDAYGASNSPASEQDYNRQFIFTYAYYQLGECAFNQNKYAEAVEGFKKSLANDSYFKWEEKNWYKIALCYFYQEKYIEAIGYFKKVTNKYQTSSNGPLAQYYLGFSFELIRKPQESAEAFQRFLELYPNHVWADKVRNKISKNK